MAILLGDGAGAAVIAKGSYKRNSPQTGLLDIALGADGNYFDLLMTATPGSTGERFLTQDEVAAGKGEFVMNGAPMFEHASSTLARISKEILAKHKLSLSDIDYVLCHQPNLRILDAVQNELTIPNDKFLVTVDKLGNMASASFPVTLAKHSADFKPNQTILMITYGSGATWGAALYRVPGEG